MAFFDFKKNNKKEGIDLDSNKRINIKQTELDLLDFYNKSNSIHELTMEAFEAFNEIERDIKKNKENKENIILIKNFLEENSRCSFKLRVFLGEINNIIQKLSLDEVSGLKIKKLCYHHLTNLIIKREKTEKLNSSNINDIEIYRYGGDEFVIVISRDIGVEVVFIDLMYLNYFNELYGHKGGDQAIYASSRIIEKTLESFKGKSIKTKDIIDKIELNFNNFKFDKSFDILNKIFFHIDTGYANDGELKEIEEKLKKELEIRRINLDYKLSVEEKREIIVELADIRSDYQKKTSKIYFLTKLYKMSQDNDKIKNIFDGYASFTKKINNVKLMISKVLDYSEDENEQFKKISEEIERSMIKTNKIIFSEKKDPREKVLYEIVLSQSIKNLCKKKPEIDVDNIIKKWGID